MRQGNITKKNHSRTYRHLKESHLKTSSQRSPFNNKVEYLHSHRSRTKTRHNKCTQATSLNNPKELQQH